MATATEQIRVTPETAERLYERQRRKESYNDVIERLLDSAEESSDEQGRKEREEVQA